MGVSALTLSNADKLRFAEVEDRITREFGDSDTMDFLEYLKQQEETKLTHSLKINFKKLSTTAITPTKAHTTDAGFDLYAADDVTIEYGETTVVHTDIAIELPEGYFADVRNRSGLTLKSSLRVHLGTIDSNYRGNVGVIVENSNHSASDFNILEVIEMNESEKTVGTFVDSNVYIKKGDRIAQLIIQKLPEIELLEVTELSDSDRGVNGFGSTGV